MQDTTFSFMFKIKDDEQRNLVICPRTPTFLCSWSYLSGKVGATLACRVKGEALLAFVLWPLWFPVRPHVGALLASHVMFQKYFEKFLEYIRMLSTIKPLPITILPSVYIALLPFFHLSGELLFILQSLLWIWSPKRFCLAQCLGGKLNFNG